MSAATVPAGGPPDAVAATRRVQQLQTLIARVRQGPADSSPSSFATALAAASAGPTATASSAGPLPAATAGVSTGFAATPPIGPGALPATGSSAASSAYDAPIAQAAARYNIDPALLHGLIQQESGFNPNSRSSAGAMGLTQLMPGTASSLGVSNPLDPVQSIEGGARYLSQMLQQFGGNTADALAAYNAGPGAVSKYGGVPPYAETQNYVAKVLGYAQAYRQTLSPAAPTGAIV